MSCECDFEEKYLEAQDEVSSLENQLQDLESDIEDLEQETAAQRVTLIDILLALGAQRVDIELALASHDPVTAIRKLVKP